MGGVPKGEGVVSFSTNDSFSLRKQRELAIAGAELGHSLIRQLDALRPLVEFVCRCAPEAEGVIIHQASGVFVAAQTWLARTQTGDLLAPWCRIVPTRLDSGGEGAVWLGCAAFGLPDLYCNASVESSGAALASAAAALVRLGRLPAVGARLGDAVVRSVSADWVELEPPASRSP